MYWLQSNFSWNRKHRLIVCVCVSVENEKFHGERWKFKSLFDKFASFISLIFNVSSFHYTLSVLRISSLVHSIIKSFKRVKYVICLVSCLMYCSIFSPPFHFYVQLLAHFTTELNIYDLIKWNICDENPHSHVCRAARALTIHTPFNHKLAHE